MTRKIELTPREIAILGAKRLVMRHTCWKFLDEDLGKVSAEICQSNHKASKTNSSSNHLED